MDAEGFIQAKLIRGNRHCLRCERAYRHCGRSAWDVNELRVGGTECAVGCLDRHGDGCWKMAT